MDPRKTDASHNERFVKIICVGAGASGLCLAYKLQRSFRQFSLTIYEKNPDVSGTWYENRYPGCACDVPSHNYAYSFEPKLDWSSVYAGSAEIRQYFREFATRHNLWQYIKPSHRVVETRWIEASGKWEVQVTDLASGHVLHNWCHILRRLRRTVSLAGKDVHLIGAGSSAVQILPAIQPIVNRVKIFIRSPTWLLPDTSIEAGQFSPEQIARFVEHTESVQRLRLENERTMNSIFTMYLRDTVLQRQSRELLESVMRKGLPKEEMQRRLIPTFAVGCKRVVPSGFRYLETLSKANVEIVYGGVSSVSATGCCSEDGTAHRGDEIGGYMGVGISEFPNTFTMLGPYTPVFNGPTLVAIEAQADYICAFIDRYQTEPIHCMAPKREACAAFTAHVAAVMHKTVWTDRCRNSHNNHAIGGRTPTTWPGSTLHYLEAIREPRYDDWDLRYTGNRFAWLGTTGISQAEWDATADLACNIRQADDDARWASRWRRNLAIAKTSTMMPPRILHRQAKLAAKEDDRPDRLEPRAESPEGDLVLSQA
ncbi:flavin-containing monooxygenase [Aspergillus fijiensis CBS 313.89]|uniref:FAD/NAD(P)-binding domain-containing protein n=1 Tax=Aspergillus fijiensis CBS 313.89 TaxID=1448319 RepID=A0A8G1RDI4_9EURO|nr:FAD/NAD(P)-binding domain-containing protein [Aspergillus fijiensis CBS 313.89]RAK71285.1 FAD/NAD(P)-binding domain-containing protein [Aspergillus fijiensis CBS 313.89]